MQPPGHGAQEAFAQGGPASSTGSVVPTSRDTGSRGGGRGGRTAAGSGSADGAQVGDVGQFVVVVGDGEALGAQLGGGDLGVGRVGVGAVFLAWK